MARDRVRRPKYAKCTLAVLRNFITARTHSTPPADLKRKDLIKILRQLDRDPAPFRFLDLPPELRNSIYELLLHRDNATHSVAQPQLLRTNKQIHNEAAGVLDTLSTARFEIFFLHSSYSAESMMHSIKAVGDIGFHHDAPGSELTEEYLSDLEGGLERLARCQNLVIKVAIRDLRYLDVFEGPEHFFRSLVQTCTRLKSVEVEVEEFSSYKQDPQHDLLGILSPLMELPGSATLRLRGVEEETEREFWRLAAEA